MPILKHVGSVACACTTLPLRFLPPPDGCKQKMFRLWCLLRNPLVGSQRGANEAQRVVESGDRRG